MENILGGIFKTTIYTRTKPVWRLIQIPDPAQRLLGPSERILIVMSGGEVASVQLQEIQHTFESNVLFQWLFPDHIPRDFQATTWNTLQMRLPNSERGEPSISALGVLGKVTGRHFEGIIEDDLIDETVAESEPEIKKRVDWHQYAFPLLEHPEKDWMDTVGNRWGKRDINGWIRENELGVAIMSDKAIMRNGQPLWPERFSLDELSKIRARLGPYKFGCQYMNDPRDPEAAAFKGGWLRFYQFGKDARGDDILILDDGETVRLDELWKYMMVDPAQTPGNRSDRTAIVVTGIDPKGRIFVLDAIGVRKDPYEALKDVYAAWEKWRPPQVGIEAVAFARLLIHPLDRMAREKGQWMPIVPIKGAQTAGAKETRINQVVGETFASGRAFIRREMNDFIDEYSWFPDPTSTRDILDAYSLSDQLWVFAGKAPKAQTEDALQWLRRARAAGMSTTTGY